MMIFLSRTILLLFLLGTITGCLDERADKPGWIPVAKVSGQNGSNKSGAIELEWRHDPWTFTQSATTTDPFGNNQSGATAGFQIHYTLPVGIE